MKVQELREGLQLLTKLLASWQAKAAANDLDRLAQLFERHDELSIAEFCAKVDRALSSPAQNPLVQGQLDNVLVERRLQELRESEHSKELFERVVGTLEAMRLAELSALANAYGGVEQRYRRKADAIKAIRDKRGGDTSARRQLKGISGIF
jgi:hypothetical protein